MAEKVAFLSRPDAYAVKGFDHRDQPLSVKRIDVTPKGKAARYGLDPDFVSS